MEGLTTAPISPLRFEPSAVLKSAVALCKQLYICFSVQYSVQNIIKLFFLAKLLLIMIQIVYLFVRMD